ncbi:MAG: hypothetical protein JRM80_01805 [Nitrososphaerota archaeon]|nr:hypothetical protein [Nitrososphaerota archaeon]
MFSIPNILAPVTAHAPAPLLLVALLGASLILIFAGRTLAKIVAFLAVGLVGAAFGGAIAAQYLAPAWSIIGVLLGFVIGGMLGVALLSVGMGLLVGYVAYILALDLALGPTVALITGVAFFIVGVILSGRLLTLATAVFGGLLLFDVLTRYGFEPMLATLVAAALTLIGLYVQLAPSRRLTQPANVGGQPGAHG